MKILGAILAGGLSRRFGTGNAEALFVGKALLYHLANVTTAGEISPGTGTSEAAIMVKNLATGVQTRVSPPLNTFANVANYQFAGLSDDGLRIAFIAQPTRTCSGYDCTANGPARMLMRDLATGQLVNLESQVRFTTSRCRSAAPSTASSAAT